MKAVSLIRILLVEDSDGDARLFYEAARTFSCKCEIDRAVNGFDALEKIHRQPDGYGLVVTDINMPRLNGRELVKIIRASSDTMGLGIIVLSGGNNYEDRQYFRRKCVLEYIEKPSEFSEYEDIFDRICRLASLRFCNK